MELQKEMIELKR